MSKGNGSALWHRIRQFLHTPKADRTEYNYRVPLLQLLEELFVSDVEFALERNADVEFFSAQKESLDAVRCRLPDRDSRSDVASLQKINYTNALHQCLCELSELALLVQQKYGFVIDGLPGGLGVSVDALLPLDFTPSPTSSSLSLQCRNRFIHFICLRMGDFLRYSNDFSLSRKLYDRALVAVPDDGQAYNQIGLIENTCKRPLESLYEHVRAANVAKPFAPATANILSIYHKYAHINIDDAKKEYDSVFLNIAGRCHFLSSLDSSCLARLSSLLRSGGTSPQRLRMHFVILAALCSGFGDSADERRSYGYVVAIIGDQFNFIVSEAIKEEIGMVTKREILSLLWLYATWMVHSNEVFVNRFSENFDAVRNLAVLLDSLDPKFQLDCKDSHLVPLSFVDYASASSDSLSSLLRSIFTRTLHFFKISESPSESFSEFVESRRGAFSEKRRSRVSRTVPILSSL